MRAFGKNVRRERRRKGLTQEELAERSEIALRNLQKIEAGEIDLRLTTALRIRLVLRCPWKRLVPRKCKKGDSLPSRRVLLTRRKETVPVRYRLTKEEL
jgi:transcriptional regulator with XRE-family HTH domain